MIEELRAGLEHVAGQLPAAEAAKLRQAAADPARLERVLAHLEMVGEANKTMNLTAIKDPQGMVVKHAVDGAAAVAMMPEQAATWLDVGTGAGFPGLTVASLLPDTKVTLMDSIQKKLQFCSRVAEALFPPQNRPITLWGRAEDLAQQKQHREQYDVVTARAVAALPVLSEYALPFVRVGGTLIAMKGPGAAAEMAQAQRAIALLGGGEPRVVTFMLPNDLGERTLIVIPKIKRTPHEYPRKAGTPERKPL